MKVVVGVVGTAAVLLGIWIAVRGGGSPDASPSVSSTSGTDPTTTTELPDDAEAADTAVAGLGSATLKIEREWDWGLSGMDGAPMWLMGDDFKIWTDHNLLYGTTESEATFEFFDGETTTFASAPVTYEVVGFFHPVFCEFELTVTETFRVSQMSVENTLLGALPVVNDQDVVTTFDVKFDPTNLDFFDIAPGSHNSSFALYDVVLADVQGCSFTR